MNEGMNKWMDQWIGLKNQSMTDCMNGSYLHIWLVMAAVRWPHLLVFGFRFVLAAANLEKVLIKFHWSDYNCINKGGRNRIVGNRHWLRTTESTFSYHPFSSYSGFNKLQVVNLFRRHFRKIHSLFSEYSPFHNSILFFSIQDNVSILSPLM